MIILCAGSTQPAVIEKTCCDFNNDCYQSFESVVDGGSAMATLYLFRLALKLVSAFILNTDHWLPNFQVKRNKSAGENDWM